MDKRLAAEIPGLIIRMERPEDYRHTEALVREAFWNRYAPGASEHYIMHQARKAPGFLPWHSLVAEYDGHVIAQALLVPSAVDCVQAQGKVFFTLGPVCVLPAASGRGIGSAIITASIKNANEHGASAVFLSGNPLYYHRFGFVSASKYGILLPGTDEEEELDFFMVLPLSAGALDGIRGLFREAAVYKAHPRLTEEYDKRFPSWQKLWLPGQLIQKPAE